jgi:hypothetical protein
MEKEIAELKGLLRSLAVMQASAGGGAAPSSGKTLLSI